jgi:hypothetical protein
VSRHRKTAELIETAAEILSQHHPMTVRQVYYQLVFRQVIENSRSAYHSVSTALVAARREGLIPWAHIEDRLRRPRCAPMWSGLPDFAITAARCIAATSGRANPSGSRCGWKRMPFPASSRTSSTVMVSR